MCVHWVFQSKQQSFKSVVSDRTWLWYFFSFSLFFVKHCARLPTFAPLFTASQIFNKSSYKLQFKLIPSVHLMQFKTNDFGAFSFWCFIQAAGSSGWSISFYWWLYRFSTKSVHCKIATPCRSQVSVSATLLKKVTSKVDGFTFVHFCLKVITSDEKGGYKHEQSLSEGITFWESLRDTETFWQISPLWTSGTFCPSTVCILNMVHKHTGQGWRL